MKKKIDYKKITNLILLIFVINFAINVFWSNFVYANEPKGTEAPTSTNQKEDSGSVDVMWTQATKWFKNVDSNHNSNQAIDIIDGFIGIVNVVGTTIIVIATIFLGIKYIFGSVDSKADVKESLITLLVACVFFFGWNNIREILFPAPGNRFVLTSNDDTSYQDLVGRVFSIFVYVANIAAILGVIYVGVRYLFAGADGRAELKGKTVYFIIGIILSFATVSFLTFLSTSIDEITKI